MDDKKKKGIKVLFLDVDGVVNSKRTVQRTSAGFIGIDPYLSFLVGKIILNVPDLKVVLSSTWRLWDESTDEVSKRVAPLYGKTPHMPIPGGAEECERGKEIKAWLDEHTEVVEYAILDDDSDMLPEQMSHFFKTEWATGITEEIVEKIIAYFGDK